MKMDLRFWLELIAGLTLTTCACFGAASISVIISYTIQGCPELIPQSSQITLSITTLLSSLIGMYYFTRS